MVSIRSNRHHHHHHHYYLYQTLGLPVFIVAIASFLVAHKLDAAASTFLSFPWTEQLAFLSILFSLIYAAVATSHVPLMTTTKHSTLLLSEYPLQEIEIANSDKDKFQCLYPMLRQNIIQAMKNEDMPQEALDWCQEMMDYNVPGGKLNRGTTVVAVYRALLGRELTATETARAAVLGWAIEFLQAFFLVADDVMDDSQTRRGQPCWYKQPKVGLIAINDSFLLESFVFSILRTHFGNDAFYGALVDLMLDVVQKTEYGQLLDLTSQPSDGNIDLDRFTLERYQLIVKYKTAFYSFYLPVALGMLLSEQNDPNDYQVARKICLIMGEYFQVQDDYLDCFGDPAVIGKVGTDIQDNKCSWLVVQALRRSSPAQRRILETNYGKNDEKKVQKVKELYKQLDLIKIFEEYEEESYKQIQQELDNISMPRDVFEVLLKKIYKRSK